MAPASISVGPRYARIGTLIERELAAGIRAQAGTLVSAGVIPTPAVAYLTPRMGYTAGVVISASHNPFEDNDQGLLGNRRQIHRGARGPGRGHHGRSIVDLDDVASSDTGNVEEIDYRSDTSRISCVFSSQPGDTRCSYRGRLRERSDHDSARLRCFHSLASMCDVSDANLTGGTSIRLRIDVAELLARTVVSGGYRIGIAHDGDGDRAIFVDRNGQIVDGDAVIVMCAKQMKREGRLKGDAVVATVMSNIGLETRCAPIRSRPSGVPSATNT